jgi:hypothetical protein
MRPLTRPHGLVTAVTTAALVALVAACGSDDTEPAAADASDAASADAGDDPSEDTSSEAAGSLAGVCPDTVTIQTDWNPEAEHGALYQMVGEGYEIDADAKTVSGPLVTTGGVETGVSIEVRAGGPAIGFESPTAQLYTDTDITLAYAGTDEQVSISGTNPVLAVVAPLDVNPQIIMWDPETYPDVEGIADLADTDATVFYFQGATYMEYLTGAGILREEQVNGSYDGSPSNFVASDGTIAQQGFATAEPYIYENEVAEWMKPVAFELINDTGYPAYSQTLAIRPDDEETLAECLTLLVPIVQQAVVDYVTDPATANALILELVEQYNTGWVYSQGVADFSVDQQLELGVVGNGDDDTVGNFDETRVQEIIDITTPIFEDGGVTVAEDLAPEDLVTNEYIDESIGLE